MRVNLNRPHSEWPRTYHSRMADKSIKTVLWANVRALMLNRWQEENINRLAREADLGPATIQRIKGAKTSIGIDVIEAIAKYFKVQPWQLIAPGMDDEKFLDILKAWQDTDGRGRRMLLRAAEGASEDDEETAVPRPAIAKTGNHR